jgi:hypothetical protein
MNFGIAAAYCEFGSCLGPNTGVNPQQDLILFLESRSEVFPSNEGVV